MQPLLEVKNLSVQYKGAAATRPALNGISFSLEPGATLGVVGESGAGKSTLALALAGLLDASQARVSGEVNFNGINLLALEEEELCRLRGSGVSMIFQDAAGSLNPSIPIIRQVAEAILLNSQEAMDKGEALAAARQLLAETGLSEELLSSAPYAHQLSGGLCQRAMITAALAAGPRLLVADEPTSALDTTIQLQIVELLKERQQSAGLALIFISHDLALVSTMADRILVMRDGCAVDQGDLSAILESPEHAYTAQLIDTWKAAGEGSIFAPS